MYKRYKMFLKNRQLFIMKFKYIITYTDIEKKLLFQNVTFSSEEM